MPSPLAVPPLAGRTAVSTALCGGGIAPVVTNRGYRFVRAGLLLAETLTVTINTPDSDGVLPTQPLAASKVMPLGRPVQVAVKFVLSPAMTTQRVGYRLYNSASGR